MFGLRHTFTYGECNACGSLTLLDPPRDMSTYYPVGYYSFSAQPEQSTLSVRLKGKIRMLPGFYRLSTCVRLRAVFQTGFRTHWRILDVGCGSGSLVAYLHSLGCKGAVGLDPYFAGRSTGLRVYTCHLEELTDGEWNLIMLHHSLEHMPRPRVALRRIHDLLAPQGRCLIRVPLLNWAWQHYGTNWVQLDAPRHLFLYTEAALTGLCASSGLRVKRVDYDSGAFQFWGSEMYVKDIPLCTDWDGKKCDHIKELEKRAHDLNAGKIGDQAAFYCERI